MYAGLYRLGYLSKGWIAGTASGVLSIFFTRWLGLENLPDYANAATNIAIRGPLWIGGTIVVSLLLSFLLRPVTSAIMLRSVMASVGGYWMLVAASVLIAVFAPLPDVWFSGFWVFVGLPSVLLQLFSLLPVGAVRPIGLHRLRERICVGFGIITLLSPLIGIALLSASAFGLV